MNKDDLYLIAATIHATPNHDELDVYVKSFSDMYEQLRAAAQAEIEKEDPPKKGGK